MKYCIDTCSLIDLGERRYPESVPIFRPIWDHIYLSINNGDLVSVDMVKSELDQRADEWREKFLIRADPMFLISDEIESRYASVITDIESNPIIFNPNKHRERFLSKADPWLIGLARSFDDAVIVTSEEKNLASYGLPEVCRVLGVRTITLLQYIEQSNICIEINSTALRKF